MIEALADAPRLLVDAPLRPVVGTTFQPTGFPDLGAAEFQRPNSPPSLLVESVQSMANRLEELGWDAPAQQPIELLAGLPYVEVVHAEDERFLTSSRLEPHRLAAAYVRDAAIDGADGTDWVTERLGLEPKRPLDWGRIYTAVFEMDPLCLIHGVFFSAKPWHGNPKVRRAITAVVEAHDVAPVISGGLKRDDVQFTQGESGRGAEEGYGFVPFGRTEYTAREIVLGASVDLAQIRGYGLPSERTELLTLLAVWELASLLESPLRLRTACDFELAAEPAIRRPERFGLPSADDLANRVRELSLGFEHPGALRAVWPAKDGKAA